MGEIKMLHPHQGMKQLVTPSGAVMYPRVFEFELVVQRLKRRRSPQPETPIRAALRKRAIQLREQGLSYPEIARELNISVGTAWNLSNSLPKAAGDEL